MIIHRKPPVFVRKVQHRIPPKFVRKTEEEKLTSKIIHKSPPIFIRPDNKKITHRTPPVFIRPDQKNIYKVVVSHSENLKKEETRHRLPPVFKNPKKIQNFLRHTEKPEFFLKKETRPKNQKPPISVRPNTQSSFSKNNWIKAEKNEYQEDFEEDKLPTFNHDEKIPFKLHDSKSQKTEEKSNSKPESKEESLIKNEISSSIESAIMFLQPEIQSFVTNKQEIPPKKQELDEFQLSSDNSSEKSKKQEFSSSGDFDERLSDNPRVSSQNLVTESSLSKPTSHNSCSPMISPRSPLVEYSHNNLKNISLTPSAYKNLSANIEFLEEKQSEDVFYSGISNISENQAKKNPIKSSFALDASLLEKSRQLSPFVSYNIFDRSSFIPMKQINYYDQSVSTKNIRFAHENDLPVPRNQGTNDFSYPSIKRATRHYNSSVTIFSEQAELPFSIRSHATLIPLLHKEEKHSKYRLKKYLAPQELERMAKVLANDLINQRNFLNP